MNKIKNILNFLRQAEKLKSVLRHSWLSSGRRESTAEHTWRMALMAMVLHPHLKNKPDLFKTLKMVLVHDLVEVYAGDVPAWKKDKSKKQKSEERAIIKISNFLPKAQSKEVSKLWQEYQNHKTLAAKYAKALDRLEATLQHQEADIKHLNKTEIRFNLTAGMKECEYDPFLKHLMHNLKKNWLKIYKKHKVDPKLYL